MKEQITVDGRQSDWFEKAVFILKDNETSHLPGNLFQYAEQLVELQLKKLSISAYKQEQANQDLHLQLLKEEAKKKQEVALKKKKHAKMIDCFLYVSITFCFICVILLLFKMYG